MALKFTADDSSILKTQSDEVQQNSSALIEVPSAELRRRQGFVTKVAEQRKQPIHKRVMNIFCNVLLTFACLLLIASTVIFVLSGNPKNNSLSYQFFGVLTDSMTPRGDGPSDGFFAGDMILVERSKPAEIRPGDIITYATDQAGDSYLTHRVREVKTEFNGKTGFWFVTRGDMNEADDPPVSGDSLVGKKIFTIPMLGGILHQMQQNIVVIAVCLLSTFGFIIALRYYFAKPAETETENQSSQCSPSVDIRAERIGPHTYIYN
jgi:signal peptidase I